MARYSAYILTGAGSSTLPIISLYGVAAGGGRIRQISVFSSTAVAVALKVVRLTSIGTTGAAITIAKHDPGSRDAVCLPFTTHTVLPAFGAVADILFPGAVIAAGGVSTFGDSGLVIPNVTTEGIGLLPVSGGAACHCLIMWDE